jgi:hypothetical protein
MTTVGVVNKMTIYFVGELIRSSDFYGNERRSDASDMLQYYERHLKWSWLYALEIPGIVKQLLCILPMLIFSGFDAVWTCI